MMKMKKISKIFKIIVLLLFFLSILISFLAVKLGYEYYKNHEDEIKIEEFYKEQEELVEDNKEIVSEELTEKQIKNYNTEKYIAVLKIPKINLERGLYEKNSPLNSVDKNIQIIKESNYPNVDKGNFILAAHSGVGKIAYFNDVKNLEKEDEIMVIFNGNQYLYKVSNKYEVDKTGQIEIVRDITKTTLTLTTCKHNTDKQIVVIAELQEINKYEGGI